MAMAGNFREIHRLGDLWDDRDNGLQFGPARQISIGNLEVNRNARERLKPPCESTWVSEPRLRSEEWCAAPSLSSACAE